MILRRRNRASLRLVPHIPAWSDCAPPCSEGTPQTSMCRQANYTQRSIKPRPALAPQLASLPLLPLPAGLAARAASPPPPLNGLPAGWAAAPAELPLPADPRNASTERSSSATRASSRRRAASASVLAGLRAKDTGCGASKWGSCGGSGRGGGEGGRRGGQGRPRVEAAQGDWQGHLRDHKHDQRCGRLAWAGRAGPGHRGRGSRSMARRACFAWAATMQGMLGSSVRSLQLASTSLKHLHGTHLAHVRRPRTCSTSEPRARSTSRILNFWL